MGIIHSVILTPSPTPLNKVRHSLSIPPLCFTATNQSNAWSGPALNLAVFQRPQIKEYNTKSTVEWITTSGLCRGCVIHCGGQGKVCNIWPAMGGWILGFTVIYHSSHRFINMNIDMNDGCGISLVTATDLCIIFARPKAQIFYTRTIWAKEEMFIRHFEPDLQVYQDAKHFVCKQCWQLSIQAVWRIEIDKFNYLSLTMDIKIVKRVDWFKSRHDFDSSS